MLDGGPIALLMERATEARDGTRRRSEWYRGRRTVVGEEAAGTVYALHPRRDRLVDGDRTRTALVGWCVVLERLAMSPLALLALALTMSHVVSCALALVEKFAIPIERPGASERLVIHVGVHYQ